MSFEGMAEPGLIPEEDQEDEGVDVLGELEKQRKIFSQQREQRRQVSINYPITEESYGDEHSFQKEWSFINHQKSVSVRHSQMPSQSSSQEPSQL